MLPLASIETRWFFDGGVNRHAQLRQWFENCAPFVRKGNVAEPLWQARAGGQPDVYLLMPGCVDMGIKWREGTLQIKGRIADLGARRFDELHEGRVQRWIKWTYAEVPAAYRALFDADGGRGLETASVHKTRGLRLVSLDSETPEEVAPGTILERGVGFELADIERNGKRYCSIAFEAFPDESATAAGFDAVVGACLSKLATALPIDASMSYPDWLRG
jgi:hypothetical protein